MSGDDSAPAGRQHAIGRRRLIKAIGAGALASGVIGCPATPVSNRVSARPLASELHYSSAASIANAIRTKQVSSEEVVRACLARIETVNAALNAVFQVDPGKALAAARNADAQLARGIIVGPLHGLPMTIKDSLDTAGVISTGGTVGRAGFVPAKDATAVARLRAAGAILLGKTNTPEFTMSFETDNAVYGRTSNPWDLARTPGGSSGGAAAIVAAGGSPFDIGSDYGGSIRMPSHAVGTAGIKPTAGRVPRTGHAFPFGGLLDSLQQIGPMARYVEDLVLLLPIIAGPDGIDPYVTPMPLPAAADVDIPGLRVSFHADNGIAAPTDETASTIRNAANALADAGCKVTEATPDGIEESYPVIMDLWNRCDPPLLEKLLAEAGTTREQSTLDWLYALPAASAGDIVDAVTRADACRSRMLSIFDDFDVIVCPANAQPAMQHASEQAADLRPFSYTASYNLTGWPGAVVRGGTSPEGLPIGVQVVAPPGREDIALAVAGLLELELGGFRAPPEDTLRSGATRT